MPGSHRFAAVLDIDKKIRHIAGRLAKCWIAGPRDTDAFEQTHLPIHLQAKIGDIASRRLFKCLDPSAVHIRRQLNRRLVPPFIENPLAIKRREFPLNFILKCEINFKRLTRLAMTQQRFSLSRVVITVMIEKDDLPADLRLQPASRLKFRKEKSPWEKSRMVAGQSR